MKHHIIVIGTSAGGVEALKLLVSALPADLPAAVCIVQHVPPDWSSVLPEILHDHGRLPASHATNDTPIRPGHIYIAPPDHHLLVAHGHFHVIRGPKENGFRPAVDALFRTAAQSYGPAAIGVVLTGMLDDGTAGLLAIKRRGGTAVVQDPQEASYPSMPESALRYVAVDHVCRLAELAPLLASLARRPVATDEGGSSMSDQLNLEVNIEHMDRVALQNGHALATSAPFSCPDCGGVLAEFYDGDLLRFRCQVGHSFSRQSMLASSAAALDRSVWAAFNSLGERAKLAERLARDAQALNNPTGERRFRRMAEEAERHKEQIRHALMSELAADAGERSPPTAHAE